MKCSRMTLADRSELKLKRASRSESGITTNIEMPGLHNYMAWLNKPCGTLERQRRLTISELVLPDDVSHVATPGVRRWTDRRPRLRSTPKPPEPVSHPTTNHRETSNPRERTDSGRMEIQQLMHEYQIDENVQKLIEEASEYDAREEFEICSVELSKKKKKRKPKRTKCDFRSDFGDINRPKLTRMVNLSLSRPPSPETEQVIRVDVISNYSIEDPEIFSPRREIEDDYIDSGDSTSHLEEVSPAPKGADLSVRCRRLRLTNRD